MNINIVTKTLSFDQGGFEKIEEQFNQALKQNDIPRLKTLWSQERAACQALLPKKDSDGFTLLHEAVRFGDEAAIRTLVEATPVEELSLAMRAQDPRGDTPVHWAAALHHPHILQLLIEKCPQELIRQDHSGFTPLHLAVDRQNEAVTQLLIQAAPASLTIQSVDGRTPLHIAVDKENLEIVKLLDLYAPEQFKEAAGLQNREGAVPIYLAVQTKQLEIAKFLLTRAPATMHIPNKYDISAYLYLKGMRPAGYKEITQQLKLHPRGKLFYKTIVERLALSHAFHIDGRTLINITGKQETLGTFALEGHFAPEWYHMMEKHLGQFIESYPDLLTHEQVSLMKYLFNLGANPDTYSHEDKLMRIQAGLPVVISTGFLGHEATVLIWGDHFVICNRGGSTRGPLAMYHFDRQKLAASTLEKMVKLKESGTAKDYQQLFYQVLPQELHFSRDHLDEALEKALDLPLQLVRNCSFVSSATGNFAFLLLGDVYDINQNGGLEHKDAEQVRDSYAKRVDKAISSYRTWLADLQLSFLEELVTPNEARDGLFEPDHALILEALRKAHLLPLGKKGQKKLEQAVALYSSYLDPAGRTDLNVDLLYWKRLSKQPLLAHLESYWYSI